MHASRLNGVNRRFAVCPQVQHHGAVLARHPGAATSVQRHYHPPSGLPPGNAFAPLHTRTRRARSPAHLHEAVSVLHTKDHRHDRVTRIIFQFAVLHEVCMLQSQIHFVFKIHVLCTGVVCHSMYSMYALRLAE